MLERALLYFIPSRGEFFKIQPGTGDNLTHEDIANGYSDYIIWNRFKPECLDIDGELEMECVDSGMVLLKDEKSSLHEIVKRALEYAYGITSYLERKRLRL